MSTPPPKLLALNVNMDTMAEALDFPPNFKDPTWFGILDRFLLRLADRGWPCSFFVVGKDLEYPEVAARVKDMADMGHEIGNHSYSHSMGFTSCPESQVREEIFKTHELLIKSTGRNPKGFMAPAWGAHPSIPLILEDLGYKYDASPFPSLWSLAMMLGYYLTLVKTDPVRLKEVLHRRDFLSGLNLPHRPATLTKGYLPPINGHQGVAVLPLPVRNRFALPVWHTSAFVGTRSLGHGPVDRHLRRLEQMVQSSPLPYYLLHPADFFTPDDFPPQDKGVFWRSGFSLKQKLDLLDRVLEHIESMGCQMVTMAQLAEEIDYATKTADKSLTASPSQTYTSAAS